MRGCEMPDIFHNQLCTGTAECPECVRVDAELAWQGPMWNNCGSCNYVRRTEGRRYCAWCAKECGAALAHLAHSLAWAATLCASFEMGCDAGPGAHVPFATSWWRPGCGKPWTWPHVTRETAQHGGG
jgi:hypothetical protein